MAAWIPDVNVMVTAFRRDAAGHPAVASWLVGGLDGTEPVDVSDLVLSGFARVVTNHRIFRDPSTPSRAFDSCAAVRSAPAAVPITAGPRHWNIFAKLCRTVSARANVIPDAYLAALALELAESCDVPADWSCRTGVCHRCQTALIAGQVTYDPAPVDPLGPGAVLLCCARPDADLVLDL